MKIIQILLIIAMFTAGLILYPQLPSQLPMHWNIRGEIDNYWPKQTAIFFMPALTLALLVLFQFLPKFDPKKDKYHLFKKEWEIIQTGLIAFFAYIQFITFYIALNPSTSMLPLMFIGLGTLFILIGNYMSKIRQNYFIGVKLPWTLASEENWNKTHRFASWCFVVAGILTLAEAFFVWQAPAIVFGSILLAAFLPMVYSFLLYKNMVDKMKYLYLGLLIIIGVIIMVRLSSSEDDWICQNGKWIRHGNPNIPVPTQPCR